MEKIHYTITGFISTSISHEFLTWLIEQNCEKKIKKLTLFLSSTGGDVDSVLQIYSFFKAAPFPIEVIGFGNIDSASIFVMLGGTKKIATENCRFFLDLESFMFKNPLGLLHGDKRELKMCEDRCKQQMEIFASETGKDEEVIRKTFKNGHAFSAVDAKTFGLLDEIITTFSFNTYF